MISLSAIVSTGIKIVIALVALLIAFKLIDVAAKKISQKTEESSKLDKTVSRMLIDAGRALLKVIVVICLIGYLGFDITSLAALVASLGVTVGLAVNGALSNIAGGILLLVTRPFKVGDYVDIAGNAGTVEEIKLVYTVICTNDNRVVHIANSTASSATIVNYSEKDLRRVDFDFTVPYDCDFGAAKKVLADMLEAEPKVLKDPAVTVRIADQTSEGLKICCRAWTKNADYWDVYFYMLEQSRVKLGEVGISAPHSQLDVHMKND